MKDLNKIIESENAPDNQNDSAKKTVKPTAGKQSGALNEGIAETKEPNPDSKKATKTNAKVAVVKSLKKEKPETEPMVQNVAIIDSKEETELDKKQKEKIKVIKKNAKKSEEKVDKLKKKVKKAKKKEVKKSKLKGLKDKLEKAIDKLKTSTKKLKKENK